MEELRKIMKKILENPEIIKIFHDCRHDSLALHDSFGSCIQNVIDTSALETLKQQLAGIKYTSLKQPGLNEQLSKYGAPNGINTLKDKMHRMMGDPEFTDYFTKRPIHPDYLEYCTRDV